MISSARRPGIASDHLWPCRALGIMAPGDNFQSSSTPGWEVPWRLGSPVLRWISPKISQFMARVGGRSWSTWINLDQLGSTWINLDQLGSTWINLDQLGSTWINLDQLDQAAHFEVPQFPTNPHIEYQKSWFRCPALDPWMDDFPTGMVTRIGQGTSAKTRGFFLWSTGWACWIMNVLWPQSLSLSLSLFLYLFLYRYRKISTSSSSSISMYHLSFDSSIHCFIYLFFSSPHRSVYLIYFKLIQSSPIISCLLRS